MRSTSALLFGCALACACSKPKDRPADPVPPALAAPRGAEVAIANEEAGIVWDAKTKTEHFIRTARFVSSFGFLVPTPSSMSTTNGT
ncbi:MAG: hypothetical protein U0414_37845 [Polyangiaceae bacterium]